MPYSLVSAKEMKANEYTNIKTISFNETEEEIDLSRFGISEEEYRMLEEYFESIGEADKYQASDMYGHWAKETLEDFMAADFLGGYELADGDYEIRPNRTITRAEFASMLVRILNLEQKGEAKEFNDVKKGAWYYDSVQRVVSNGIANGKPGNNFKSNDPIIRVELASMIYGAFKHTVDFKGESKNFKDVSRKHWAKGVIDTVSKVGIVGGYSDGTFKPSKTATRAEAIVMLKRAMDKEVGNLDEIENIIKPAENARLSLMIEYASKGEIEPFIEALKENTTGVYPQEVGMIISLLIFFVEIWGDQNVEIIEVEKPKFQMKKRTDRLAIVRSSEVKAKFFIEDPETGEMVEELPEDSDENAFESIDYYLKKMKDGSWKVYKAVEVD